MARPTPLLAVLAAGLLAGCTGTRTLADPTLVVRTSGGTELGVSTDYGPLFLGRTARAGAVDLVAWFGDGPSVEPSTVEPIGGGLYTAETEIRLPRVRMTFVEPPPGAAVVVAGRTEDGRWELPAVVAREPRVDGLVLEVPDGLPRREDQVGAGVFVVPGGDRAHMKLLGLVSGRLVLDTEAGRRELLTVVGPRDLWRLVALRRDHLRRQPWVYREDIL